MKKKYDQLELSVIWLETNSVSLLVASGQDEIQFDINGIEQIIE